MFTKVSAIKFDSSYIYAGLDTPISLSTSWVIYQLSSSSASVIRQYSIGKTGTLFADGIKIDSGFMYVSYQNHNSIWTLMKISIGLSTTTTTFYLESSYSNSAAYSNSVLTDTATSTTHVVVMGSLSTAGNNMASMSIVSSSGILG